MIGWLLAALVALASAAECGWTGEDAEVLQQLDGGCALLFSETEQGPMYLLLHGLNDRADSLARSLLVRELRLAMKTGALPAGHVLLPNGGGGYWTDWLDGTAGYERLVHDVIGQVEHRKKVDEVVVIGISMGGFAALSIGLRHPNRITKMVAFSPTDLMLATAREPNRSWYTNVYGTPIHQPYVAARDPRQLVLRGAGKGQQIAIVIGDAEPEKFWLGVQRFATTARAQGLTPALRVVQGGDHSARLTWGAQSIAWVLEQLSAWYYGESSQPPP